MAGPQAWANRGRCDVSDFLFLLLWAEKRPVGRRQAGPGDETGLLLARARWRRDPFSVGPSASPPVSPHRGLAGKAAGSPVPTFLHQLLVSERTAHDQQHSEKHEAQDDAHHGACARAHRVWVLACGEAGGSRPSHPMGIKTIQSKGSGGPAPPVSHWHVRKAVICLAVSPPISRILCRTSIYLPFIII